GPPGRHFSAPSPRRMAGRPTRRWRRSSRRRSERPWGIARSQRWPGWASERATRRALGLVPGFAMVDPCAADFAAETPYFYATYAAAGSAPEALPVERPAA